MRNELKARTHELIVERVGDEVVVYDERSQTAHALSREATAVWESCDGSLSPVDIAEHLGFEPNVVERALDELRDKELLEGAITVLPGHTRRAFTAKLAAVGGAAFAAPFVYSVSIAAAQGCHCSKGFGTGVSGQAIPPGSTCTASGGSSGTVGCDCSCQSGQCYKSNNSSGTDLWCVPAGCTGGNTAAPGGDCSKCCAGTCSGSSTTCASSAPA